MKYIRTKEQIIAFGNKYPINTRKIGKTELWGFRELTEENFEQMKTYNHWEVINQADTIEELCDEFEVLYMAFTNEVILIRKRTLKELIDSCKEYGLSTKDIKGCIRTSKGLIYVAEMNKEEQLCLI